jgi:hypothetical protein
MNAALPQIQVTRYFSSFHIIQRSNIPGMLPDRQAKLLLHFQGEAQSMWNVETT